MLSTHDKLPPSKELNERDKELLGVEQANLCHPNLPARCRHYKLECRSQSNLEVALHKRSIKSMRVVLLGVLEAFRSTGVAAALYTEIIRRAFRLGYQDCEMSWVLDDNLLMIRSIELLGGRRFKT
jgi:GNAT superfamily N-acetyltransferase